jgi:hypothetical protein
MVALFVIVLGLLSFIIYKTVSQSYISATDSTNSFSYSYPDNWVIEPYEWVDCCEGPAKKEPNWSKVSQPITLHPNVDSDAIVTINTAKYGNYSGYKSFEDLKNSVKEDYFAKILFESTRDDGHEALFSRVDYLGPPDAKVESFTDHRYYFDNGKSFVQVEFREKYHHDWPDDEANPDIDNSEYLSDFEHIAKSFEFNN